MIKRIILLLIIFSSFILIFSGFSAAQAPYNDSNDFNISDNSSNTVLTNTYSNLTSNELNNAVNYPIKKRNKQLFVKFKFSDPDKNQISINLHSKINAQVIKNYKEISGLQLVSIPDDIGLDKAINLYLQSRHVVYAEPDQLNKKGIIPNDPGFPYQWGLYNYGQSIYGIWGTPGADINAINAWNTNTGSNDVIIAILDTGIHLNHNDLLQNLWINRGEIPNDGIDNDGNGYIDDYYGWDFFNNDNDPSDDNGHGTMVAGVIAAIGNNNLGITGVMWNAQIMSLKFLDDDGYGYDSDALNAILYANQMGADIINNSWESDNYSKTLKDALEMSKALIVCAAGNDSKNNDLIPDYPSSYSSLNILSVASTDADDYITYFTNYGIKSVDVAAPGVDVYSTTIGNSYGFFSGTSASTAFVSGLAGLIKSLRPELTNIQIKNTIINNVDVKTSLIGKILTGGRINASKAINNIIVNLSYPKIIKTTPEKNTSIFTLNKIINIYFNQSIRQGSSFGLITLKNSRGQSIFINKSIKDNILMIKPSKMNYSTKYYLKIPAGAIRNSYGNYFSSDYDLSFTTSKLYSSFIKVQNRSYHTIHFIYYFAITKPGQKTFYQRLSSTIYRGKTKTLYLGKFPRGTKFIVTQYIYNKYRYRSTVKVRNTFLVKKMKYITQNIYMKRVRGSPRKLYQYPVYALQEIQISTSGLKIRKIKLPRRL
ncbi:MAG: S8 family serine peptidase [Methanomicrobiales archaeon]